MPLGGSLCETDLSLLADSDIVTVLAAEGSCHAPLQRGNATVGRGVPHGRVARDDCGRRPPRTPGPHIRRVRLRKAIRCM